MIRFFIYFVVLLAPLPFASARPVWKMAWVVIVGIMTLGLFLSMKRKPLSALPKEVGLAISLAGIFVAWGLFQGLVPVGHFIDIGMGLAPQTAPEVLSTSPLTTLRTTLYFLAHLLFFTVVFFHVRRSRSHPVFFRNLGIIVSLYALYGFTVYALGNDYILWYEKWANEEYLTSTFVNRNSFAAFAGLGLLCLMAHTRAVLRDRPVHSLRDLILVFSSQWWLPVAFLLVVSCLFLTGSRGGFISVLAGIAIFFLVGFGDLKDWMFRPKRLMVIAVVMAMAAGLFTLSGKELGDRLSDQVGADDRFDIYPLMVDAISDQPLTGYGLGTFEETFRIYRTLTIRNKYFMHGHNDYLELAMTAGLPATILLLAAFCLLFCLLWRARQGSGRDTPYVALAAAAMVQMAIHSAVDFPLQIPAVSYLWVAILAAGLAATGTVKKKA